MALCILHGLTDPDCQVIPDNSTLNLDGIAYYFGRWSKSAFDIGNTTRIALDPIKNVTDKRTTLAYDVLKQVAYRNKHSESNGALMRISPLIVWARHLSDEDLYHAVKL